MDPQEYELQISTYSPETIPMGRLAEYMDALARLMGNAPNVHFARLRKGSCVLVAQADTEAQPKIKERLREAGSPAPSKDIKSAYSRIDQLLRDDNATGRLTTEESSVVSFPGIKRKLPEAIGPFKQQITVEGELARVGGTDQTAHALIVDPEGHVWSCELTRDTARVLGGRLYEPIRITGDSRWVREKNGVWSLKQFKLGSYEFLEESELTNAVERLRGIGGNLLGGIEDKAGYLRNLRGEDVE